MTLDAVTKRFAGVVAVADVSLEVPRGKVFGLIGPNGAGKTTLVNLVTGYLRPDSGTVTLDGSNVVGMPPYRLAAAGVARTYQNLRLFESSTVLENVLIGRHLHFNASPVDAFLTHRSARRQRSEAEVLIDRVGLSAYRDEYVDDLPYGLRRRVEIARALATGPSVLLLDEPAAGMTHGEAREIGRLVREINADGVSIVVVEHNVALVTEICDEVAVMDWGRVIARGAPRDVWEDEQVRTAYLGKRRKVG